MTESFIPVILILVIVVWIALSLKVVEEDERLVVNTLGRFVGLRGPGLVALLPPIATRGQSIKLGAQGIYIGADMIRLGNVQVPIEPNQGLKQSDSIQVSAFGDNKVIVTKTDRPMQTFQCEKCGHSNHITS